MFKDDGLILKYDGTAWSPLLTGRPTCGLRGVWGSDANNVWAVGEAGTILKYDGSSWSAQSSGTVLAQRESNRAS